LARNFVFLTNEGHTQDESMKDVENIQVLGYATGETEEEAFENLKRICTYLSIQNFNEVYARELVNFEETPKRFYLKGDNK
jgi:uncharacterized protein YgfB (UPF0149 family)